MNILFSVLFILSNLLLLCLSPKDFLPALLDGTSKSATLCFSLIATYSVWLGLMEVWKKSGVTRKVSRLVKPLSKRLFKTDNDEILDAVCMNLSVNMLGVSGAGTPYGITACKLLDKTENAEYSSALFFVLNATSLQIIPTSVVGIRTALGSVSPADIILPTFLSSTLSTLLGFLLVKASISKKTKRQIRGFTLKKAKTKGAGI